MCYIRYYIYGQALSPFGAIFGGPLGGWIADCWGRKCGMMFCGVPYLIGYVLLSYAHYTPTATTFKVLLLTGLFVCGIGIGWTSAVVPVSIHCTLCVYTCVL